MKRTKNMIYRPSEEARELYCYSSNNGILYHRLTANIEEQLKKKINKGVYDSNRAIDAFYMVTCEASKMYNKDFSYSFSVTERFTAAVDLKKDFELEYL